MRTNTLKHAAKVPLPIAIGIRGGAKDSAAAGGVCCNKSRHQTIHHSPLTKC